MEIHNGRMVGIVTQQNMGSLVKIVLEQLDKELLQILKDNPIDHEGSILCG